MASWKLLFWIYTTTGGPDSGWGPVAHPARMNGRMVMACETVDGPGGVAMGDTWCNPQG